MHTRQLYASFSATANAAAFIDINKACRIKSIQITLATVLDADGEDALVEVSKVPYAQTTTNDALNVLAMAYHGIQGVGTPATIADMGVNIAIPTDIPMEAGERVYLNGVLSGTTSCIARVLLLCTP